MFDTHRYRYTQRLCWLRPWPARRRQNEEFLGPTLAKPRGWLSLCADALIWKWLLEANGEGRVVNVHIVEDADYVQYFQSGKNPWEKFSACGMGRWPHILVSPAGLHLLPQGVLNSIACSKVFSKVSDGWSSDSSSAVFRITGASCLACRSVMCKWE